MIRFRGASFPVLLLSIAIHGISITAHATKYIPQKSQRELDENSKRRLSELARLLALEVEIDQSLLGGALASELMFVEDFASAASAKHAPRFMLLDSRLRMNPEMTGKLLQDQNGTLIQLEIDGNPVAAYFSGFSKTELETAVTRFQKTYAEARPRDSRSPASETVSANNGASVANPPSEVQSYGLNLWKAFKGCGRGIVNGANSIILYPVYALNSAKVYVFGGEKIDGVEFAKDPFAAVFLNEKRSYQSAFKQSWKQYWENEARAAKVAVQAISNFEEIIAKSVDHYSALSTEEKNVVNCALASGVGGGFAVRASQNVAARTLAASSAKAERIVETPAAVLAKERAQLRANGQLPEKNIPKAGVVDAIPVSADDAQKIYGTFDPSKVVKSKAPPEVPVTVLSGRRYQAHLDVGDGRKMLVNFEIVSPPTPTGRVTIRFENPLHRGQLTERSMRQSELELSPGFKALDD